ncbi:hypothetical protein ACGH47_11330, partial [Gilliamella sp. CG16]
YRTLKSRNISLRDLRIALLLEDKFSEWFELKRKVIEPSIEEINKKSDLKIAYKPLRKERSIDAIEFYIEIDTQIKMFEGQEQLKKLKKKIGIINSNKTT